MQSPRLGRAFFMVLTVLVAITSQAVPVRSDSGPAYKVLHVMSYHADWVWNVDQFNGFKDALQGLNVEYRVVEMDAKRKNSPEWLESAARRARTIIEEWKPDLVYTNDDAAQEHVAKHYVNTDLPIVFSAVNSPPEQYGFAGSSNVAGVLETEHFVQTVRLLKEIAPQVEKIAVIVDQSPMWGPVLDRMKEQQDQLIGVRIVSYEAPSTFEEFKAKVRANQSTVDALGLLGIFNFKDAQGGNVHYKDVLKWVADNSRLPDFSYWKSRVECGTLCAVTVSGYEQGQSAGKIARGILTEGKRPSDFPMISTKKGEPVVSLARAQRLGLQIKSGILLSSDVLTTMDFD